MTYDESVRAERPAIRLADEANRARASITKAIDNLQRVQDKGDDGSVAADAKNVRLPRGVCPVCGRSCALRNDGTVRHHYGTVERGKWCLGGYEPDHNDGDDYGPGAGDLDDSPEYHAARSGELIDGGEVLNGT